jgi:hypothetical protein
MDRSACRDGRIAVTRPLLSGSLGTTEARSPKSHSALRSARHHYNGGVTRAVSSTVQSPLRHVSRRGDPIAITAAGPCHDQLIDSIRTE